MRSPVATSVQSAFDLAPPPPTLDQQPYAVRLRHAALDLVGHLARGHPVDARLLRSAMTSAFGGSDGEGAWAWKDAYEACEVAELLFLRRYLSSMRKRASSSAQLLEMVAKLTALLPTHTRRTEESQNLQQFSTPLEIGLIASIAAGIDPGDCLLEPSAGTGQLAIFGEANGASLVLDEISETRADLLSLLFPESSVTRLNAEHINDVLPNEVTPSVVLMNPPFSASPNVKGGVAGTDLKHLRSALMRLAPGGRLVAVTGAGLSPENHPEAFASLGQHGTLQFTAPIAGSLYRRHGTTVETRLTVFDRMLDTEAPALQACHPMADSAQALLHLVEQHVPPRRQVERKLPDAKPIIVRGGLFTHKPSPAPAIHIPATAPVADPGVPLSYTCIETDAANAVSGDALYEPYTLETIRIEGAKPHPTQLVQSAAMASVRPPKPSHQPLLPAVVLTDGLLSDAQLESVVYAGEAHAGHLAGRWSVNETLDVLSTAPEDDDSAVQFRRGWFLGDGTGAGKGRQIAGIVLDNWLRGRRRAVWISKSDKLIEDAQRDWSALGQEKLLIVPQDRYRQGKPIRLGEGILFTTYATLRSAEREGKASRLTQIIDWLGTDFDGVIVFDEAHAMANAAGGGSDRGKIAPSQQGLAGLRVQHALPNARIVYVSATGATTVENLAYAQRLGLWGGDDFPFPNRAEFVSAMQQGGIASMEVLARDLKALGLYASRSLSYEGVEVDILDHDLTPEQIRIYDAYAKAFQVIHNNLDEALKAANITSEDGTLNRNAKAAARSAFESSKQRFFNHLITAMKVPSLIRDIEAQLTAGHAAIVQLVSTSEALMDRRLGQIPASEWNDLTVDITPREYVLDYLAHSFPTQLYETYSDSEGNLLARPVMLEGQPVHSKEAEAARDRMIEKLASLPPVQAALDQIIHHFGTDTVAEVTGRGRRIVRKQTANGPALCVVNRPGSSNLAEAQAYMDDDKRILVFSDAGGTGRSYHADLTVMNQRLRVHYLLEAGWKADTAIQGLGRSNRTNQKQPPLFRPVATDVRGEKRFLSTIARRLDSLGAITRGQRQTGGQGMFRPEDNLESVYARAALRTFYWHLYRGQVPCCSLQRFIEVTGLNLLDGDGTIREELPPITTFLNRMLALQIDLQNALFAHFEGLLVAQVEGAMASGSYDIGLETITAESLVIASRHPVATHAATGAETMVFTINRKDRNKPRTLARAMEIAKAEQGILLANSKSGRAAVQVRAASWTLEDGTVEKRVRLIRPMEALAFPEAQLEESNWVQVDDDTFTKLWTREVEAVPQFTTSQFHIVTGLLLPIWKRLPADNPRVYRFTTDGGERVIGRLIPPDLLDTLAVRTVPLTADEAFAALKEGRRVTLADGFTLKRSLVMHAPRIELIGFTDSEVEGLKAQGCLSEIIAWRLRLFVPTGADGPAVLARLMAKHPPVAHPSV